MSTNRRSNRARVLCWGGMGLLAFWLLLGAGCGGTTTKSSRPLEFAKAIESRERLRSVDPELRSPRIQTTLGDESPADSDGLPAVRTDGKSNLSRYQKLSEGNKLAKAPIVWHRVARRPTLARVYVGDGNSLELVSIQVTVTVEGPRARTVVDHIFRNPHDKQLEGTFEYPLPTGASPSYFAKFLGQTRDTAPARFSRRGDAPPLPQNALARLSPSEIVQQVNTADWGRLQEAHVVAKGKALETYEQTVRGKIDPALLEYAGGNNFSGRVFPIPAKGYNRVILAYEETLSFVQDRVLYRFPLPDGKLTELQFTLQADAAECREPQFQPKDATFAEGGGRFLFTQKWNEKGPGGEAQFDFTPTQPQIQAVSGRQGESGPLYVYARVRPDLKAQNAVPFAEQSVFLLDTSLSEHPDRFWVSMQLLRAILETDPDLKRFNILTFNIGAAWVEPKGWIENTAAGREKAFSRLEGVVLEGATDLTAALDKLVQPGFQDPVELPVNVFLLSDGQITWGESDSASLAARFESRCPFPTRFHCYHTGLGADNQELFQALTRKAGGVFNCFGDADLAAAAAAHRNQCLRVDSVRFEGGPSARDVLIADRKAAIYPGGDLAVAAQVNGVGSARVVLEGEFLGNKFVQDFPLEITGKGDLAARGWGEIAVASLLALNDPALENLATAYCQQFGVGSRVASFLVLENEADYKRLNLEDERGRTITGDMSRFLDDAWRRLGHVISAKESFQAMMAQVGAQAQFIRGGNGAHIQKLLAFLTDKDFEPPESTIAGAILKKTDVPREYLAGRNAEQGNVAVYVNECRRRAAHDDADGAVRVLSSIAEEYPSRADALRLVGYRLLDLRQPAAAVRLFGEVQRSRPFEPHSYRDLARSLEDTGRFGLAALQYEIVLAGTWHNRFRESLKFVTREEYAQMMRQALKRQEISKELAGFFRERLGHLAAAPTRSDLRVTISWNTDATDVDLWVIEPGGIKCFYQNRRTSSGGELTEDMTQGYGPERYQTTKALAGEYRVLVHYYSANRNLLGGETHVNVTVTRNAGTPREVSERHTVILKRQDEQVEVCRVKF